jgi:biopolymer transport protein ExbB
MWQFLVAGGPFMFLLVLTSVIALAFIIERGLALRRAKVVPHLVEEAIDNCQGDGGLDALRVACAQSPSALATVTLVGIEHLAWPKPENADSVQTRARQEVVKLERGLVVLEVVVGIAPLLGLVGTIHGMIILFGGIGRAGLTDNAMLAKGIAVALNTTLMGLLIAIPALVAWSYFTKKVESMAIEMETLMDEFLRRQYRRSAQQDFDPRTPGA